MYLLLSHPKFEVGKQNHHGARDGDTTETIIMANNFDNWNQVVDFLRALPADPNHDPDDMTCTEVKLTVGPARVTLRYIPTEKGIAEHAEALRLSISRLKDLRTPQAKEASAAGKRMVIRRSNEQIMAEEV